MSSSKPTKNEIARLIENGYSETHVAITLICARGTVANSSAGATPRLRSPTMARCAFMRPPTLN